MDVEDSGILTSLLSVVAVVGRSESFVLVILMQLTLYFCICSYGNQWTQHSIHTAYTNALVSGTLAAHRQRPWSITCPRLRIRTERINFCCWLILVEYSGCALDTPQDIITIWPKLAITQSHLTSNRGWVRANSLSFTNLELLSCDLT